MEGDLGTRSVREMVVGVVVPLLVAGVTFVTFPGWPAVIVGALAIIVMALTAARLTR